MKYPFYLYFSCCVAIFGGIMFGFDIAIIAGAIPLSKVISAGMNSSLMGRKFITCRLYYRFIRVGIRYQ